LTEDPSVITAGIAVASEGDVNDTVEQEQPWTIERNVVGGEVRRPDGGSRGAVVSGDETKGVQHLFARRLGHDIDELRGRIDYGRRRDPDLVRRRATPHIGASGVKRRSLTEDHGRLERLFPQRRACVCIERVDHVVFGRDVHDVMHRTAHSQTRHVERLPIDSTRHV